MISVLCLVPECLAVGADRLLPTGKAPILDYIDGCTGLIHRNSVATRGYRDSGAAQVFAIS